MKAGYIAIIIGVIIAVVIIMATVEIITSNNSAAKGIVYLAPGQSYSLTNYISTDPRDAVPFAICTSPSSGIQLLAPCPINK